MIAVMAYPEYRSVSFLGWAALAAIGAAVLTWIVLSHFSPKGAELIPPSAFFASLLLLPFSYAVSTLSKLHDLREGKQLSDLTTAPEKRRLKSIVNSKASKIHALLVYYVFAAAANIAFATVLAPYPSVRPGAWSGLVFLFVISLYSLRFLHMQRQEVTDFIAALNERQTRRERKRDMLKRLER